MDPKKHKLPFPPHTTLKRLTSKLLDHLNPTKRSRRMLEMIVKELKKEGRNVEAAEISKIIKKIIKHERMLAEEKKKLLIEYDELKFKELSEFSERMELFEKKIKELMKELVEFFKELKDPALKEKLSRLEELHNKLNHILAEISTRKKEIEQCKDAMKQNEKQIEINIQEYNRKADVIDQNMHDLVSGSDFLSEIEAKLQLFLEESGIKISLPDHLIKKLLLEHINSHHDFKAGDSEWDDDFARFCVANIIPLLPDEQKKPCKEKLQKLISERLLSHREQASELYEKLTALKQEKEALQAQLKQNNGILEQANQRIREKIKELDAGIKYFQSDLEETQQEIKDFVRTEGLTEHVDLETSVDPISTPSTPSNTAQHAAVDVTKALERLDFSDEVGAISSMHNSNRLQP